MEDDEPEEDDEDDSDLEANVDHEEDVDLYEDHMDFEVIEDEPPQSNIIVDLPEVQNEATANNSSVQSSSSDIQPRGLNQRRLGSSSETGGRKRRRLRSSSSESSSSSGKSSSSSLASRGRPFNLGTGSTSWNLI